MIISYRLPDAQKTLYNFTISDDYLEDAVMSSKLVEEKENQYAVVRSKLTSMPGFCLLDTQLTVHQTLTEEVVISGEHVRLLFSFEGNGRIWDASNKNFWDTHACIVRRQYQQNSHWQVELMPNQQVSYVVIILSKAYATKLLQNEPWVKQDAFLNFLLIDEPEGLQEEQFFMELPVKKVLHELMHTDYTDLTRRYFVELKLKELLFVLHTQSDVSASSGHLPPEVYKKLVKAKALLLSRLNEPPTTKQLSRLVALNELRLKQDFKVLYGITIHAFIISSRMEKAQKLLLENCSVNDMSARLGYRSVSHFIQTFKKHFGETPKQALSRTAKFSAALTVSAYTAALDGEQHVRNLD